MRDFEQGIAARRFRDYEIECRVPGSSARIRQIRPDFLFGSNVFPLCSYRFGRLAAYRERVAGAWNAGTLPFYWGRYEPREGRPDPGGRVMRAARWAKAHGFSLKGHPLCWHTVCADWLLKYSDDRILGLQLDRIRRDVSQYKGLIDAWDVVNEAVIMPSFDRYDNAVTRIARRYGAEELLLKCFAAAREADPAATLLINDFDLSERYAELIARLLDRGCPIDAIGLQTHMHEGYRGAETVEGYLERFSRFGLPIHFTELTILSGRIAPKVDDLNDLHIKPWPSTPEGEARQLAEAEEFYRQVYSHPLSAAIIWWDMVDGGWLGAPAGLLRADLSPKPAFERVKALIKGEWAFAETEYPIEAGKPLRLRAPEGSYEATIGGRAYHFALDARSPRAVIG
jgi:GH35 family endo-1,4-beta-xylanase